MAADRRLYAARAAASDLIVGFGGVDAEQAEVPLVGLEGEVGQIAEDGDRADEGVEGDVADHERDGLAAGAEAAAFVQRFKQFLEDPVQLLV